MANPRRYAIAIVAIAAVAITAAIWQSKHNTDPTHCQPNVQFVVDYDDSSGTTVLQDVKVYAMNGAPLRADYYGSRITGDRIVWDAQRFTPVYAYTPITNFGQFAYHLEAGGLSVQPPANAAHKWVEIYGIDPHRPRGVTDRSVPGCETK